MVSRTHQTLIEKLFPKDELSQRIAANFISMYELAIGNRIEGLLQEAVAVNARVLSGKQTGEQALEYLGSFAQEFLGILPATVQDGLKFLSAGAGLTAEDFAATETLGAEPANAPSAPAQPATTQPAPAPGTSAPLVDRNVLRERTAKHEANMRAPQGSDGWRAGATTRQHKSNIELRGIACRHQQTLSPAPAALRHRLNQAQPPRQRNREGNMPSRYDRL
jgi:hypothetical protein